MRRKLTSLMSTTDSLLSSPWSTAITLAKPLGLAAAGPVLALVLVLVLVADVRTTIMRQNLFIVSLLLAGAFTADGGFRMVGFCNERQQKQKE